MQNKINALKTITILMSIGLALVACSGGYEPDDLGNYLRSGTWVDEEYGAILTFKSDGLYVWKMKFDADDEENFATSMLTGMVASNCAKDHEIEAFYEMSLSEVLDELSRCNLSAEASDTSKPGMPLFADGSFAIVQHYEVIDNKTVNMVDMFGDDDHATISAKSVTAFTLKDSVDTYHFVQ